MRQSCSSNCLPLSRIPSLVRPSSSTPAVGLREPFPSSSTPAVGLGALFPGASNELGAPPTASSPSVPFPSTVLLQPPSAAVRSPAEKGRESKQGYELRLDNRPRPRNDGTWNMEGLGLAQIRIPAAFASLVESWPELASAPSGMRQNTLNVAPERRKRANRRQDLINLWLGTHRQKSHAAPGTARSTSAHGVRSGSGQRLHVMARDP